MRIGPSTSPTRRLTAFTALSCPTLNGSPGTAARAVVAAPSVAASTTATPTASAVALASPIIFESMVLVISQLLSWRVDLTNHAEAPGLGRAEALRVLGPYLDRVLAEGELRTRRVRQSVGGPVVGEDRHRLAVHVKLYVRLGQVRSRVAHGCRYERRAIRGRRAINRAHGADRGGRVLGRESLVCAGEGAPLSVLEPQAPVVGGARLEARPVVVDREGVVGVGYVQGFGPAVGGGGAQIQEGRPRLKVVEEVPRRGGARGRYFGGRRAWIRYRRRVGGDPHALIHAVGLGVGHRAAVGKFRGIPDLYRGGSPDRTRQAVGGGRGPALELGRGVDGEDDAYRLARLDRPVPALRSELVGLVLARLPAGTNRR